MILLRAEGRRSAPATGSTGRRARRQAEAERTWDSVAGPAGDRQLRRRVPEALHTISQADDRRRAGLVHRRRHRHGPHRRSDRRRRERPRSATRRRGCGGRRRRRCGSYRLGLEQAKRYLFTGDEIPAAEAQRIGLVLECVPDDELHGARDALAQRMALAAAEPAADAQALLQRAAPRQMGPARAAGSARCSTASPATPRRASTSSPARRTSASARPCASATTRSATTAPARARTAGRRVARRGPQPLSCPPADGLHRHRLTHPFQRRAARLTPRERVEVRIGRIMAALPPEAQVRLSGMPPLRSTGSTWSRSCSFCSPRLRAGQRADSWTCRPRSRAPGARRARRTPAVADEVEVRDSRVPARRVREGPHYVPGSAAGPTADRLLPRRRLRRWATSIPTTRPAGCCGDAAACTCSPSTTGSRRSIAVPGGGRGRRRALRWAAEHAADLGADPAGWRLAATAREATWRPGGAAGARGAGPPPPFQLLIYPATD